MRACCLVVWASLLACPASRPPAADAMVGARAGARPAAAPVPATAAPDAVQRRAVLVGIDDYGAGRDLPEAARRRGIGNLEGAVNDVRAVASILTQRYGFKSQDILVLTDQEARRQAILDAIETRLIAPARRGDIELFYYSGHGSQIYNSKSDEPDLLDETLVPADMLQKAEDIRDKELRRLFNRILDRGAGLTAVFDSCHSASLARDPGLATGARPRGIEPDLTHDAADGENYGPRPEERGALVLAATEDFSVAWETRDAEGRAHGAFSLALLRAMRAAAAGEPAVQTFERARALLQAERRDQQPAIAGDPTARHSPLLGERTDRAGGGMVVAVESVQQDGTLIVEGGWANGLSAGCRLQPLGAGAAQPLVEVTEVLGVVRSAARLVGQAGAARPFIAAGTLLQVVAWTAGADGPLRVWMPAVSASEFAGVERLVRGLHQEAARAGMIWLDDPTVQAAAAVVRWRGEGWEILQRGRPVVALGPAASPAVLLAGLVRGDALFVQVPAPRALVQQLSLGPGTPRDGVQPTEDVEAADYILVGRLHDGEIEFGWMRPESTAAAPGEHPLPVRSDWYGLGAGGQPVPAAGALQRAVLTLRKIHAWQHLEAPPDTAFGYRLGLWDVAAKAPAGGAPLAGGRQYEVVLRLDAGLRQGAAEARYVYVFVIDSHGKGVLLFPPDGQGAVENRFPLPADLAKGVPPAEIRLGQPSRFRVAEPYGVDSYFLLTTDEPIPDPSVLAWEGVLSSKGGLLDPMEELLARTGGPAKGVVRTPVTWSLERRLIPSVDPARVRVPAATENERQRQKKEPCAAAVPGDDAARQVKKHAGAQGAYR